MDRHLNTVVALSKRVSELKENNGSLLDFISKLKEDIDQLEEDNARLRSDLKELSKEAWHYKNTNK